MKIINLNKEIRKRMHESDIKFKKENGQSLSDPSVVIDRIITVGVDDESKRMAEVYDALTNATAYTDMMTSLLLKKKTGVLDAPEEDFLELLKGINTYDELMALYSAVPEVYSFAIKDMLDFHNGIAYHKILRFKCLSCEDIAQISKINPLLTQDLQEYDIDVTIDYIIKKIFSNIGKNKSEEDLLNDATAFVTMLLKVDKKAGYKVVMQMIENDIKVINFMQSVLDNMTEAEKSHNERLQLYKNSNLYNIIDTLDFDKAKSLLCSSILYAEGKQEIDRISLSEENNNVIEEVKKMRLGNQ